MKMFVIKAYEGWSYCGGGGVILAKDLEEANSLLINEKEKLTNFATEEEKKNGWYLWEVVEIFELPEISESRIVLLEYNWA